MKEYCVYFHLNSITKEIFYVGKGKGKRPYTKTNRGKFYVNYIKKYGDPLVIIIANKLTGEEAIEIEKYYIKMFGRRDNKTGILVNCTDGGEGCCGLQHTKSSRKKISEGKKGVYSAETIKRMSDAHKGIKMPKYKQRKDKGRVYDLETRMRMGEGKKKPILQYTKNGEFIKEWKSTTDAEKSLKINGIRNTIDKEGRKTGGFIWKRKILFNS